MTQLRERTIQSSMLFWLNLPPQELKSPPPKQVKPPFKLYQTYYKSLNNPMLNGQQYQFIARTDSLGRSLVMSYLPLTFTLGTQSVAVNVLLDTGSSVNVLP